MRQRHALSRLTSMNLLNEMFHIWYVGPFGTINGLRLGRTKEIQVRPHRSFFKGALDRNQCCMRTMRSFAGRTLDKPQGRAIQVSIDTDGELFTNHGAQSRAEKPFVVNVALQILGTMILMTIPLVGPNLPPRRALTQQ